MDTAEGFDRKSKSSPVEWIELTTMPDNVEKIIWNDLSDVTATINAQANGFTRFDYEQSFAVVWSVRHL